VEVPRGRLDQIQDWIVVRGGRTRETTHAH
jgi:hypothetical protein